jgi:hypothetical protein
MAPFPDYKEGPLHEWRSVRGICSLGYTYGLRFTQRVRGLINLRSRCSGGRLVPVNHDAAAVAVDFAVDGGEGAELEIGDVGQDRGAAGSDAIFDEETAELGEEIVDLDGGAEVRGLVAEGRGQVGIDERGFEAGGVAEAEGGVLRDWEMAAAAGAGAITAGGDG